MTRVQPEGKSSTVAETMEFASFLTAFNSLDAVLTLDRRSAFGRSRQPKSTRRVHAQAGADKDAEIYWILSRLGGGDSV
jgi:hypothetical protein